jgi:hypothetical protein
MKSILKLTAVVLLLILAGCSYDEMLAKIAPEVETEFAKSFLTHLRQQDFNFVESHLAAEVRQQATVAKLQELASYFPEGELKNTELIGCNIFESDTLWQGNFTFEYEFSGGWALGNVVLRKTSDTSEVLGFRVYRTIAAQSEINKFTLDGKSPHHYIVLALAVAVPIFILISLVFCVRTPLPKRKWLWVLFILMGFGKIMVNWTTGQYGFQLLSFNLLGAEAVAASPHAPWVISASLPLGAIIFWVKRKSFVGAKAASQGVEMDAE